MRGKFYFLLITAVLFMPACGSRPEEELTAAREAVESARTAQADVYAPEAFQAATQALESAEAEIQAQNNKSFLTRDYDRARELLSEARTRADAAVQAVAGGREQARRQAEVAQREAETALQEARGALDSGPRGKGTRADREALQGDLRAAEASFSEGQDGYRNQRYADALNQFKSAREKAEEVKRAFEQARSRAGRAS